MERSTGLFDANSELFKKTLMISMAMLSCGIMLGLCWEVIYRIRKNRKVEPHSQGNFDTLFRFISGKVVTCVQAFVQAPQATALSPLIPRAFFCISFYCTTALLSLGLKQANWIEALLGSKRVIWPSY